MADHRDAATAGSNDVIVGTKRGDKALGGGAGVGHAAGVRHRLAAADLRRRELDLAGVEMLEQSQRGDADARIELVDVARDEEADSHSAHYRRGGWRKRVAKPRAVGGRSRGTELLFLVLLFRLAELLLRVRSGAA